METKSEHEEHATTSPAHAPIHMPAARVPVLEETLQIEKVRVDRGGYRLTKRVETRDQLVDELLQNHHVEIERRPIGEQLPDMQVPQARYEGDTLIVPVVEEVIVSVKRLVLMEEVRITRITGTHRAPETFPLRKEEIEIERLAAESGSDKSL